MPDSKSPQSESTDLPPEFVRRIDALYERLASIDHYALLGLERSATRSQVRQAFLLLAPQFHPDRYFGKNLGSYAAKMQRVFAQLSVAHDTLVNDERRAEYTEALPPPLPLPSPPPAPVPSEPPREAAFGSTSPRAATPMTPAAADAARARQQAFAARLAGHSSARMRAGTPVGAFAASGSQAKSPPGEGPRRTSSAAMPAVDPKAAVDALKRRYEETVAHARGATAVGAVHAAEAAAAKGDFAEAARFYRVATEQSSDPSLRAALVQTETKAREQQHGAAIARAKEAEQKQDYGDAGVSWARAFDISPAAETAHRASLCFRRAGADPRRAAKYGEEAVKLDGHKASYRVNLALVYCDLGLSLRARGEIERAQALDPGNAQVKEALSKIKAMK
jgi:curved DNA-binding protein CbpA